MQSLKKNIRKNIIAGLLVTVPIALTYMVLAFVVNRVDRMMEPLISGLFGERAVDFLEKYPVPGVGFLLIVSFVVLVGLLATNFIGRKIVEWSEKLLHQIPFVRAIYTSIKKVIDTISQSESPTFQEMVLLTYPHEPLKTLGIVCSETQSEITDKTGVEMINVFIPTSPNPTTGFMFMVPKSDLVYLDMSVEDGLKTIISFGMVNPPIRNPERIAQRLKQ